MQNDLFEIASILAKVDNPERIESFLMSLLTRREVEEIVSRWKLVKLLNSGMSQRKIANSLGLSLCKITRGSKELKKENSAFRYMLSISDKFRE